MLCFLYDRNWTAGVPEGDVSNIEMNRKLTVNKRKAIRHSGTVFSRNVTHAYKESDLNISATDCVQTGSDDTWTSVTVNCLVYLCTGCSFIAM
jgi:hypothetical protein